MGKRKMGNEENKNKEGQGKEGGKKIEGNSTEIRKRNGKPQNRLAMKAGKYKKNQRAKTRRDRKQK